MVTQRAILIDSCFECPFYDLEYDTCHADGGPDEITNPDKVHEDCPLDVISINAMPKNPRYERDSGSRAAV
jgi:hypothetical protein